MSNPQSLPAGRGPAALAATPVRRGAKAVVTSSSQLLLVRERHSDGRPFWTLPGGGVEPSESLLDGLRRELDEELRCDPVVGDTLSTFWYAHIGSPQTLSRYTVFSCSLLGDVQPVRSEGILETAWVAPDELPARTLPQVRFLLRGSRYEDVQSVMRR